MGVRLQRSPTTRSLGAKNSRHSVLSQAEDGPGTECELSKGLGDTACTHQRTDQVARTEAVCRRSVCGVSGRAEAQERGDLGSLLCRIADWPDVGIRSGRNPPSKVRSPVLKRWIVWRGGGQRVSNPHGLPLRFGSLRSPKRSGSPCDAPTALSKINDLWFVDYQNCYQSPCAKCYQSVCASPRDSLSRERRAGRGVIPLQTQSIRQL